ncbi:MAG TPA: hypothetical protein VL128_10815 [Candidatus Eisenbacteria bacterium]|nr:hypothetical protein [Candidatus Eisenbacteria bacterium]
MALITEELSCSEQLARFFPKIPAAKISVRVEPVRPNASPARLHEAALVEYASPEYAIFVSTLPLEFDDRVRISREGGGRSAEAVVIALQYHDARKAIAVRFLNGPCEWMKPL